MDPTLRLLLALPPARPLVLALLHRLRRVPIPDALVPTVQQLVVGHVVRVDVLLHLLEGPGGERVDLDEARLVDLDDLEGFALGALRAAAAREHRRDVQVRVGALRGLDLGDPVVEVGVRGPELLAVAGLEVGGGGDSLGSVDVEVDVGVAGLGLVDEVERLLEVVECVEEDGVDGGERGCFVLELGEHVEGDQPGDPEGGGLVEIREGDLGPPEDVDGGEEVEG